ncbi:MAG: hypothetical protein JWO50_223 [Candidatus Kaiserbacteria bacterium]|nr:hypothetical protein [Candidatus Kaiserbacteria bacterium]
MTQQTSSSAFTLIETLVAVSILTISIVAPMVLASQSLQSAYYARDQVVAENLAQEAIEAVRSVRDGQVLLIAKTADASGINLFGSIPIDQDFTVDPTKNIAGMMSVCSGPCAPLQTDGILYGYNSGWASTQFVRTVHVVYVTGTTDEVRVQVTVSWKTQNLPSRTFTISENMYRWISDGSGT